MREVGARLRRANVAAIYLAHGTFVGPDALGVLGELGRVFPRASHAVRRVIKRLVDQITGEVGNYTDQYASVLEAAINEPGERPIPVHRFHWSSENHHIGRADGAVRLIHELASLHLSASDHVLLWGHSHAGNVFALTTNLLADNWRALWRFFEATEIYYRWPVIRCVDIPVWAEVRRLLEDSAAPLGGAALDMVTFGTPIRYGWDSEGYAKLLHFINHHPAEGLPEYRAPFPPQLDEVMAAARGDYIQQLGIAGTNVTPSPFAWRSWLADVRLNRLLQENLPSESLRGRFEAGTIVPQEGTTLLVDYGPPEGGIAQHVAGHAVYTSSQWMLFHAEEVARRFYAADETLSGETGG